MTKGKTYFIFILIFLIKSSIFAIEPTIDTSKINQIRTFNNDRIELLKRIIYSIELQKFEIEEIALSNFIDFDFEGTSMGVGDGRATIMANPVLEVIFTKKDQISFDQWYGKVTAYLYKDDVHRQKLVDFIDSSFHDSRIDFKFFLLCSHLMEKNDTIRQEIGKNLLNELSSKDSLPGLFNDFIDIPDFINTTSKSSYVCRQTKVHQLELKMNV